MGNALRTAHRSLSLGFVREFVRFGRFSAVCRGSGDIIHHQLNHGAERRLSRSTIYGIERRGIQFEEEETRKDKAKII